MVYFLALRCRLAFDVDDTDVAYQLFVEVGVALLDLTFEREITVVFGD